MGRRGPAPRTAQLALLQGERPSRVNTAAPVPRELALEPPSAMSKLARQEWDHIAPELTAMGTARLCDSSALAAYCEAVARFRLATALVEAMGVVVETEAGTLKRNPACTVAAEASNQMRAWAREFGLTPSARAGIRVDHHVHYPGQPGRLLSQ